MKLVDQRVKAGKTETVTALEVAQDSQGSAQIIDLTELLKRSLKKPAASKSAATKKATPVAAKKTAAESKSSNAKKTAAATGKTASPKKRAA